MRPLPRHLAGQGRCLLIVARGCLAVLAASVLLGRVPVLAQSTPQVDQLRVIAPAAPGGGWDQTARVMQQVLQEVAVARRIVVENVPGAAGTIGLARFVGSEQGNGDVLMVSGLIMLGGVVMHRPPVTLRDVTPIARITGEYEAIVVPAQSPIRSLDDLIRVLRERPESISWGGGSAGGSDQILAGLVAKAVGVQPARINYIAFSGGGESLSAILGGQVTVGVNGLAELEPQIAAGTVRALAISSAERLPGLAVPTLIEQGVDVEFENWRSVVAPPGISAGERRRLESAVEAMVRSPQWQSALARYRWLDRYLSGEAFARFAGDEETRVRAVLDELGVGSDEAGLFSPANAYPAFVLAGLGACGVALMGRRRPAIPVGVRVPGAVWWVAGALAINLFIAEPAGFIVSSSVLFWGTARAFDRRHPVRDALVGVGVCTLAYAIFARLLQLQLP